MKRQRAHFFDPDSQIYLYSGEATWENKGEWDATLRCQITHMGKRAYLFAITHNNDLHITGVHDIFRQLKNRGVEIVEYHHNHKLITHDTRTGKTHCERCEYVDHDEQDRKDYDDMKPKCRLCYIED